MSRRIISRLLVVIILAASVVVPRVVAAPVSASAAAWPVERVGSSGPLVFAVQYLLQAHGRNLAADGAFGPKTQAEVAAFQKARGLSADGVVGEQTWGKLIVTVRQGQSGPAVRAVQYVLAHQYGAGIAVDGAFGPATNGAVTAFQRAHGLGLDGIVGPQTWNALITGSGSAGNGGGASGGNGDRGSPARQILGLSGSGRIALATRQTCCPPDGADPLSNIRDTANGGPAKRSSHPTDSYGDCGPGGSVYLDTRMLRAMVTLAQRYSYYVTAIAGGTHTCTGGRPHSLHFAGRAFDVAIINGRGVSISNPNDAFQAECRALGAGEVLSPDHGTGHPTHIHCGWY